MAGTLKELGREWGMSFLDHSPVWFRGKEGVKSVSRSEFKEMVRGGKVNLDTSVFDNAVVRVSDLEGKGWEKPAGASWHRRAFFTEEGV